MTTADILALSPAEINRMNTSELRSIVQQLGHTARGRTRRIEKEFKNATVSPAYTELAKRGDVSITTAGKNLNQLRSEFKRAKIFLESKTSTVKGTKKELKKVHGSFEKFVKGDFDKLAAKNISEFWKAFHRQKEQHPEKYDVQREHVSELKEEFTDRINDNDLSVDDIHDMISEYIDEFEEEYEARRAEAEAELGDLFDV